MRRFLLMFPSAVWRCGLCFLLIAFAQGCASQEPDSPPRPEERTVEEVLALYGAAADQHMQPYFARAGVLYPPAQLALLGFKREKRLEVWARQHDRWVFVRTYPILAASGRAGPKLQEGDQQVPEGLYNIEAFNPNSSFHLSMKLDYPNAFDRAQAAPEGRQELGGDIFIHGNAVSAGCLAMGDKAVEELFVLVARVGMENVSVLLAPHDFRRHAPTLSAAQPAWVGELYRHLQRSLKQFRR
jgi:L,D-transpeptidase catalytic domain